MTAVGQGRELYHQKTGHVTNLDGLMATTRISAVYTNGSHASVKKNGLGGQQCHA